MPPSLFFPTTTVLAQRPCQSHRVLSLICWRHGSVLMEGAIYLLEGLLALLHVLQKTVSHNSGPCRRLALIARSIPVSGGKGEEKL